MSTATKATVIRAIERQANKPFRDLLIEAYREEKSQKAVADRLAVPLRTLQRVEDDLGVERRFPDGTPLRQRDDR
jgi:hypothetical protein